MDRNRVMPSFFDNGEKAAPGFVHNMIEYVFKLIIAKFNFFQNFRSRQNHYLSVVGTKFDVIVVYIVTKRNTFVLSFGGGKNRTLNELVIQVGEPCMSASVSID